MQALHGSLYRDSRVWQETTYNVEFDPFRNQTSSTIPNRALKTSTIIPCPLHQVRPVSEAINHSDKSRLPQGKNENAGPSKSLLRNARSSVSHAIDRLGRSLPADHKTHIASRLSPSSDRINLWYSSWSGLALRWVKKGWIWTMNPPWGERRHNLSILVLSSTRIDMRFWRLACNLWPYECDCLCNIVHCWYRSPRLDTATYI